MQQKRDVQERDCYVLLPLSFLKKQTFPPMMWWSAGSGGAGGGGGGGLEETSTAFSSQNFTNSANLSSAMNRKVFF